MKKRIASIALSLAMCLTLLPTAAYADDVSEGGAFDSQASTGDGAAVVGNEEGNTALYGGSGTESDPYQIGTADGFYAFAKWYNENQHDGEIYAELTADINLNEEFTFTESAESGYTGEGTPKKWTPIGSGAYFPTYSGEFDGNGHTISGLYIKEDNATVSTTGLFGYFKGYLHDVKIVNSYIFSKSYCTGAFAGIVEGTIEDCTADAVVYSDANASGFFDGTGGIVGNLYNLTSKVLNCTFSGSVSSDKNPYVGGIVGDNLYGYVAGCTNYGKVTSSASSKVAVGGIVGQNRITYDSDETAEGESSVIERCINNGSISGTNSAGGIVGVSSLVEGSSSENKPYIGAIRNCLNTGSVSGGVAGGIIGYLEESTNVDNCLNIGTVSGTPAGAIAGVQLSSCKIADSYYRENGSLTAVGQLGTSNGSSTPSENEKISDTEAKATESQISGGEISWKLNTNNGTQENSEIWAINAGVPTLASDTVKPEIMPTYRVVFAFPEETNNVIVYTSADGKAEIPDAAKDKALTYDETKIFTGNTVVTADMTVTVAEKQACTAPVFAKNTDTLTEETDDKAQFTLKEEPVSGAIFKVYSAETGGELVGTASYSGKALTVTLNTIPTSNTSYYISMEVPNTTESARTEVVVNAYKKPASSSGGGGGSSTPRYAVTVPDKTENGSLSVTPKNAKKGSDVTITATPDKGYEVDDIVAKDAKGNKLTLKDNGDGTYTFTMPASKVTIEATFAEKQAEPIVPEKLFADVSAEEYYYEAVKWASENGVTGGIGENLFGAKLPCTRAQIVTFQWRAAGSPEPKGMSGFVDVSADAYYAKAVAWAVEQGIVSGTSATTFSPDAVCTRAQSVAFLYRAFGTRADKAAGFSDVSADAYYADAVAWAVENGVVSGIGGGLFAPDQDCARGQIVAFLYRAYQNK